MVAKVRIMYWKEIPVQVQAQDESGTVSKQLDPRFQEGVDAIAMFDGSSGTDDYLTAWEWGDFSKVDETADEAAENAAGRLDSGFPQDFVARVRDLHRDGKRDPTPGAVDHWTDESREELHPRPVERHIPMASSKLRSQTILERLKSGELLISDGATGTYLQQHGLEAGGCLEELNASHPEVVRGMARDYFDAGSDMVLTNSFGGSRFMQKKYGFEGRVGELNRLAAEHAASQKPSDGHFVVGSVGPTGEMMEPLPDGVSESEMYDALAEQITALAEGGADAILVETQMALEEAITGVRAARENTDLPVFATMVFDLGPRGFFTMMGVTPEKAVTDLRAAGADVVGTNCGNGIDRMIDLAAQMRAVDDGLMLIHSNAGIPDMKGGQIIYNEGPEYMAERFKRLADMGINVIGGCCGTGPDHIRALRAAVKRG